MVSIDGVSPLAGWFIMGYPKIKLVRRYKQYIYSINGGFHRWFFKGKSYENG
jgi:hypothetical protein